MSNSNRMNNMLKLLGGGVIVSAFTFSIASAALVITPGSHVEGSGVLAVDIVNNGSLHGDENAPLVVLDPYIISGTGEFANTSVLGTFAPGNSPGIASTTNLFLGGTLEIELGGVTPGFGSGHHDQVNDSATFELGPAAILKVIPFEGFVPSVGDTFTIATWQNGLVGDFDVI